VIDKRIENRSLLQRRNSLKTQFQTLFDGVVVVFLVVVLSLTLQKQLTMPYVVMTMILLGVMAITYDRFSVYRLHGTMTEKGLNLAKAWTTAFFILLLLGFVTKNTEVYSRKFMMLLYVLGFVGQAAVFILFNYLQRLSVARSQSARALIIGTGFLANHIFDRINNNPWMSEEIVGTVVIRGSEPSDSPGEAGSAPVVGKLDDIHRLISENEIETVYIAVPLDASPIIKEIYFDLLDSNLNIHWAPNIFTLNLINHSVKELAGIPILTLSESPLVGSHILIKAVEDRVLSLLALILLCPIMLATAIAIKLESPGPVFFRQIRTGWDGREFRILKFRSMRAHRMEDGELKQATRDDPRVTRVGRFIRRTSIDELPQLFNVLMGQMSLVGPRPHAIEHNEAYSKRITAYLARHRIKPGITGLAQVRGYRGETRRLEQMEMRVKYDLDYINNWSLGLDLSILVRTVFTLFGKKAY